MASQRETVLIELIDDGDPHAVTDAMARPFGQRLRAALKSMLRRDGLRCKRLVDADRVTITVKAEGETK